MSLEQLMLAKPKDEDWQYLYSSQINIGDYYIKYDFDKKEFIPVEVITINEDDEPSLTFAITVEDTDLFLAGNILVHNK
jgi:intein/homing endonuclease